MPVNTSNNVFLIVVWDFKPQTLYVTSWCKFVIVDYDAGELMFNKNTHSSKLSVTKRIMHQWVGSVLFFSRPRSKGRPHHGRTFSIYPCPLSFWLTLPQTVLSTSWCCPSRLCVAFLAFVHLALFLALSLSPENSLVSSLCDHSMLASLLWRCLTVPSLLQLC